MNENVGLGRIAGVRVGVNWSLLPIFLLIAWSLAVTLLPSAAPGYAAWGYWVFAMLTTVAFYASLLAHELAHALVARRHGVKVNSIVLWLFGGVAQLEGDTPDPRAELQVAAAGPVASFGLAGAWAVAAWLFGRLGVSSLMVASVGSLAGINVLLGLFNLLPAFPLDGGRILRAALWRHWRDRSRATAVAAKLGRASGFALIAVGAVEFLAGGGALGGIWLALIGWFISVAAEQQPESLNRQSRVAELTVADAMSHEPLVVSASATVAEVIERCVLPSRFSSFPVVDADGQLVGLATVRRMAERARGSWAMTSISAVAAPRSEIVECGPEDRLAEVAARLESSPDRPAIVLDGERVVGILTPSDVARAITRTDLLGQPSAARARATGRDARARAAWGSTRQP
jgi:Zn-dependent protease/CBS domain-containing protein